MMFISRLAAKRRPPTEQDLSGKYYLCNSIDPKNRFKRYSLNEIVNFIIVNTNGRTNVTPNRLWQRSEGLEDLSEMVAKYIYEGKQNDRVQNIYSPWSRTGKDSLQNISKKCNISADALWGIYSSSKAKWKDFINKVYEFIQKNKPLQNNLKLSLIDTSFEFGLSTLLDQLKLSPGAYYKKFINTAIENNLNEYDTLKLLFLNHYNKRLAGIEKNLKINNESYTFDELAEIFNTTSDDIKLFIIFNNFNIKKLIQKIMKKSDFNGYIIHNNLMTVEDIAKALKVSPDTVRQYKEEQNDQFETFIEHKLDGKLQPETLYITINNQDYTFEQIVDKFRAQGYSLTLDNLNQQFNKILSLNNDNYTKALKELSKIVKNQLTGKKPFDLNKTATSRLKWKLYS